MSAEVEQRAARLDKAQKLAVKTLTEQEFREDAWRVRYVGLQAGTKNFTLSDDPNEQKGIRRG